MNRKSSGVDLMPSERQRICKCLVRLPKSNWYAGLSALKLRPSPGLALQRLPRVSVANRWRDVPGSSRLWTRLSARAVCTPICPAHVALLTSSCRGVSYVVIAPAEGPEGMTRVHRWRARVSDCSLHHGSCIVHASSPSFACILKRFIARRVRAHGGGLEHCVDSRAERPCHSCHFAIMRCNSIMEMHGVTRKCWTAFELKND